MNFGDLQSLEPPAVHSLCSSSFCIPCHPLREMLFVFLTHRKKQNIKKLPKITQRICSEAKWMIKYMGSGMTCILIIRWDNFLIYRKNEDDYELIFRSVILPTLQGIKMFLKKMARLSMLHRS